MSSSVVAAAAATASVFQKLDLSKVDSDVMSLDAFDRDVDTLLRVNELAVSLAADKSRFNTPMLVHSATKETPWAAITTTEVSPKKDADKKVVMGEDGKPVMVEETLTCTIIASIQGKMVVVGTSGSTTSNMHAMPEPYMSVEHEGFAKGKILAAIEGWKEKIDADLNAWKADFEREDLFAKGLEHANQLQANFKASEERVPNSVRNSLSSLVEAALKDPHDVMNYLFEVRKWIHDVYSQMPTMKPQSVKNLSGIVPWYLIGESFEAIKFSRVFACQTLKAALVPEAMALVASCDYFVEVMKGEKCWGADCVMKTHAPTDLFLGDLLLKVFQHCEDTLREDICDMTPADLTAALSKVNCANTYTFFLTRCFKKHWEEGKSVEWARTHFDHGGCGNMYDQCCQIFGTRFASNKRARTGRTLSC